MHANAAKMESDPWCQFSDAIDVFTMIYHKRVVGGRASWIRADQSMSAWKPRTTDKSGSTKYITCCLKAKPTWTEL
jgi:hypothetical protein